MKTYVVSMGCPKNLVDTEAALTLLRESGCTMTDDPADAELLIVNACSFLDVAWRETVEEVERLALVKHRGRPKKLVLMGCLPRHRSDDLAASLPDVDHVVAAGAHARLPALVEAWRRDTAVPGGGPCDPQDRFAGFERRVLLTPPHTAYVKIAEGCSRRCSFCAIPRIRGKMVSRSTASIIREVEGLVAAGVKEISLLAQDITSYHDGNRRFPDLVSALAATGIEWVRIFYVHPGSLTLPLVRTLFSHPSVCRYLETPVQHASDRILKRMRRSYTRRRLEALFDGIRREFPDVVIRSEAIVGFPGEAESDFEELKSFIASAGFSSLGIFQYSAEAGTGAGQMAGQLGGDVKAERAAELQDVQDSVALDVLGTRWGQVHRILVDRRLEPGEDGFGGCTHAGRYYGQALSIDGEVHLLGGTPDVGAFVDARIMETGVVDMTGEIVRGHSA